MGFHTTNMVLLMLIIISACEAQLTTKHDTAFGSYQGDSSVHEQLKILKEELHRTNAKLEEALKENQKMVNESLSRIETEVIGLRNEREMSIASAFMARHLSNFATSKLYDAGEKLVFSEIVYNQGNHYNSSSGEYSCPVKGIYFFAFTLYGSKIKYYTDARVYIRLHTTGGDQSRVFVQNNNSQLLYMSVSQAVVIECNTGEKVWLETLDNTTSLYGRHPINNFSGTLLRMI